jgi:hypothetical protein
VFESHNFIGRPHPHLGKLAPLEFAMDEHLLPPIFQNPNPQNNEIDESRKLKLMNTMEKKQQNGRIDGKN